jgi:hypothetical protein
LIKFGLVIATITAPSVNDLKVPVLPVKTMNGTKILRGTFSGWWFSEELKAAKLLGYKIIVHHAY